MIKKFNRLPIYMTCSLFILLVILTLRCNFFITILAYNSGKNMRIEIKSEDRMGNTGYIHPFDAKHASDGSELSVYICSFSS